MILFWHRDEPIGICVFASPAASLAARSAAFGLVNPRSETALAALNANLWLLQRVVLHPTYRGAGLAAPFVRRACAFCPVDWIETLSVLGRINPFFERAGFVRRGAVTPKSGGSRAGCYGGRAHCTGIAADRAGLLFVRQSGSPDCACEFGSNALKRSHTRPSAGLAGEECEARSAEHQ